MEGFKEAVSKFWKKHPQIDGWRIKTKLHFSQPSQSTSYHWFEANIHQNQMGDIVTAHSEIDSASGDFEAHEQQAIMRAIEMLPE